MSFQPNVIKNMRSRVLVDKDASTVITQLQVIVNAANGLSAPATSAATRSQIKGVSTESISADDALTQLGILEIFENDTWIADTLNNSNADHTNQRMLLNDSLTVNNTGSDDANGVVEQLSVVGDPDQKKIVVRFV